MPHQHFILMAEDLDGDALLIRTRLKQAHFDHPMLRVHDGAEVMAYLKGEGQYANRALFPFPSVLLLDLHMPKVNGFEVLDWVSRQPALHRLLVVAMSSATEEDVIQRVYQAGAHAFVCKHSGIEAYQHLAKFLEGFFNAAWSGQFLATNMDPSENPMPLVAKTAEARKEAN